MTGVLDAVALGKASQSDWSLLKDQNTFGALHAMRRDAGLSRKEAAAKLGVSLTSLTRWENDASAPSSSLAAKVAHAYGATQGNSNQVAGRRKWSVEEHEERPVLRVLRLKRRRSKLGLIEVAQVTGVSVAALQRYETGEREPAPELLANIATAVGMPAAEIKLLNQALFSGPANPPTIESVFSPFSCADSGAHINVFAGLDAFKRFGEEFSSAERKVAAKALLKGMLLTGDSASCLEAWDLIRPPLQAEEIDWTLKTTVAVARVNVADRVADMRPVYEKLAKHASALISADSDCALNLVRVAQLSGQREEADLFMSKVEERFGGSEHGPHIAPYRRMVDAAFGQFGEEQAACPSQGPIWNYTRLVTEFFVAMQAKRIDKARELRAQSEPYEANLGLGSPLARRLDRKLATA